MIHTHNINTLHMYINVSVLSDKDLHLVSRPDTPHCMADVQCADVNVVHDEY